MHCLSYSLPQKGHNHGFIHFSLLYSPISTTSSMPSRVQRNIGSHIYRNYPISEFLGQVWRLDIDDLPEGAAYNLPRPIRSELLGISTTGCTADIPLRILGQFQAGDPPTTRPQLWPPSQQTCSGSCEIRLGEAERRGIRVVGGCGRAMGMYRRIYGGRWGKVAEGFVLGSYSQRRPVGICE